MDLQKDLRGRKILVTGATSGIGRGVVKYLAECGAFVIMTARNREKLRALHQCFPETTLYLAKDLENSGEIAEIFRYLEEKQIKLDGMAHSAGITLNQPVLANEAEDMRRVMQVNYFSFAELMKYFGKKKISNDGASVVALSSVISLTLEKGLLSYASSKAAVNAAVVIMAKELLKRKIRVNAILLGNVRTEMFESQKEQIEDFEDIILQKQPLGVIGTGEVARFTAYLLSSYAKYMTGLCIPMDAGYLLNKN